MLCGIGHSRVQVNPPSWAYTTVACLHAAEGAAPVLCEVFMLQHQYCVRFWSHAELPCTIGRWEGTAGLGVLPPIFQGRQMAMTLSLWMPVAVQKGRQSCLKAPSLCLRAFLFAAGQAHSARMSIGHKQRAGMIAHMSGAERPDGRSTTFAGTLARAAQSSKAVSSSSAYGPWDFRFRLAPGIAFRPRAQSA